MIDMSRELSLSVGRRMSGANQSSAELVFNCRLVNIKREKNRRFHLKIQGVLENMLRCVISSIALC